jgi:hypothetical protein
MDRTAWHHLVSYLAPAPVEAIVVSLAHTDNDIAITLQDAGERPAARSCACRHSRPRGPA